MRMPAYISHVKSNVLCVSVGSKMRYFCFFSACMKPSVLMDVIPDVLSNFLILSHGKDGRFQIPLESNIDLIIKSLTFNEM